jgi:hypothetical protein
MPHTKHRTQISLEQWQYNALLETSSRTRKSLSGIVRDLINEKYKQQTEKAASDPVMGIVGMAAGDGSPVAGEHDRFLYGKKR